MTAGEARMTGIDAATGRPLAGAAHLAQSIGDILTTPIGTRVGRRDYGSALHDLQDQPMNGLGRLRVFAATATALARWEPRLTVTRVTLERASTEAGAASSAGGAFTLRLEGVRTDDPSPSSATTLSLPLRLTA